MKGKSDLVNYEVYLRKKLSFTETTIGGYCYELNNYLDWRKKSKRKGVAKYIDIIDYIEYLKKKHYSYQTIAGRLTAVKHYYNFKKVKVNPVQNLNLKGRENKVLTGLLTESQINNIYNSFKKSKVKGQSIHYHRRNLVMLGLLCYQGVKTNEINKIKLEDISLDNLKVFVPKGRRTNGRTLEIKSNQLIDLFEYITKSRERTLNKIGLMSSDYLVVGNVRENDLTNIIDLIPKELKERVSYFQNMSQIRNSIIVNWLKIHNLRRVQYMAGHKYVSSTEKFKIQDISKLKEAILKRHPLG